MGPGRSRVELACCHHAGVRRKSILFGGAFTSDSTDSDDQAGGNWEGSVAHDNWAWLMATVNTCWWWSMLSTQSGFWLRMVGDSECSKISEKDAWWLQLIISLLIFWYATIKKQKDAWWLTLLRFWYATIKKRWLSVISDVWKRWIIVASTAKKHSVGNDFYTPWLVLEPKSMGHIEKAWNRLKIAGVKSGPPRRHPDPIAILHDENLSPDIDLYESRVHYYFWPEGTPISPHSETCYLMRMSGWC